MSTRWYPIYQRGNPQLRVFLPNFWMKLVRPSANQQPNLVEFHCSMEMTKHDIKNYLEKIYNVPVIDVKTRIALGKFRKDIGKGYIVKDDDIKFAYVTLVARQNMPPPPEGMPPPPGNMPPPPDMPLIDYYTFLRKKREARGGMGSLPTRKG
nr:probable 39S ribosomal protein L23, mitochondrial isoform X1 [Maniola hyperantus]